MVDTDVRSRIEVARVRRARLVAPVDTLPELDASDWAIAATLNDLLQATNHELGGLFTKGRYTRLLQCVHSVCWQIPHPRDVGVVLARHATFARVMELVRTDTSVSWWTGSASFRGVDPPKRLLLWQGLRRVHVDTKSVPLSEMGEGLPAPVGEGFLGALSVWLSCSPLTDIACVTRTSPLFSWTPSTIALVGVAPGRTLAFRVLSRLRLEAVKNALERARSKLEPSLASYQPVVDEFTRDALSGLAELRAKPEKRSSAAPEIASD
jgi:hypothetical protein